MTVQDRTEDEPRAALRAFSLVESEAFRKRCSDRLLNLPRVVDATDDLYSVCCVLPQDPTDEQLGDLAFRLSNFLEDVHRRHVDRRADASSLGMLGTPMSLPIIHRAALRAQRATCGDWLAPPPKERETVCLIYLNVPRWTLQARVTCVSPARVEPRTLTRGQQIFFIDGVAREHGLRCVETGTIPQD